LKEGKASGQIAGKITRVHICETWNLTKTAIACICCNNIHHLQIVEKNPCYTELHISKDMTQASKQAIRESNPHAKANQKNLQIEETRLLYA
jgi:uncharacterized protein YpiB (UPF0302 family)